MSRLLPGTTTREENAARWRRLVRNYQHSPLTQADYCERHGVALSSFCRWRRRLGELSAPPTVSEHTPSVDVDDFVPVRVVPTPRAAPTPGGAATLSLTLPNGLRIENIDAENVSVVAALVAAL